MIDIKRYNGTEEFNKLLKTFTIVPTNTEIVEKTGVSKGSVSEIMQGKRTPTKNFIEKFKKGFNIGDVPETKNPQPSGEGFYKDLITHYKFLVERLEKDLDFERSKNNKI